VVAHCAGQQRQLAGLQGRDRHAVI
jgi:hypothetical protein